VPGETACEISDDAHDLSEWITRWWLWELVNAGFGFLKEILKLFVDV
jgi:hypothetical protein